MYTYIYIKYSFGYENLLVYFFSMISYLFLYSFDDPVRIDNTRILCLKEEGAGVYFIRTFFKKKK